MKADHWFSTEGFAKFQMALLTSMDFEKMGAGVGGMNWEIGIDIYTLLILCVK